MDVDQSSVACDALESIVVASWLALEQKQNRLFKSVASIEHLQSLLDIELFKDEFQKLGLPYCCILVDLRMLAKNRLNHATPVLQQTIAANLMRAHIVRAESLHSKVVDKAVFLDIFNV